MIYTWEYYSKLIGQFQFEHIKLKNRLLAPKKLVNL